MIDLTMKVVKSDETGWEEVMQRVTHAVGSYVQAGVFSGEEVNGEFTMAELAAVHEWGSLDGRIPERSFSRAALRDRGAEIARLEENLSADYLNGKITWEEVLRQLGELAVEAIKAKILAGDTPPPLAKSTVDRKGHDRTLVDTGALADSIEWRPNE